MAANANTVRSAVSNQNTRAKAQQFITAFQSSSTKSSTHYPNITKARLVAQLSHTINTPSSINQIPSSLCGPAGFFYTLASTRPDVFVQAAIDLYTKGQATIGTLKLQASAQAKQFNPSSSNMRDLDWMMLSSVKDNYHNPSQQFAGITLPSHLKSWFSESGFTQVHDDTSIFSHKSVRNLLNAQLDFNNGYTICMLVDSDAFETPSNKKERIDIPDHWVVLTSDIQIEEYDEKTKKRKPPVVISTQLTNLIEKEIRQAKEQAEDEADMYETDVALIESQDRITFGVFTWGQNNRPPYSRVSSTQNAGLYYFLRHYYGYVKAK